MGDMTRTEAGAFWETHDATDYLEDMVAVDVTTGEALKQMDEEDIDLSEIPEVTAEQIAQATLRVGGKPVSRGKVRVNIYLDAEVVDYFKAEAGGRGYQTLIKDDQRRAN